MKLYSLYFMSFHFHFKLIAIIITVIVKSTASINPRPIFTSSLLQCYYKSSGQ